MPLSQRQAAQQWHVSRAAIQRAVHGGKLSLTLDKTIDPAEMVRVFGEPVGRLGAGPKEPHEAGVSQTEYDRLKAENEHLRAMLSAKDQNLADLRQALALTGPQPARRHWWQKKHPEVK